MPEHPDPDQLADAAITGIVLGRERRQRVTADTNSLAYRRGRSGRPLARAKARLKREGTHICWRCGHRIDLTLDVRDAMSWTLDHAIPLSLRPDLALDPTNHREAHRRCNSARGNRLDQPAPMVNSREW